MWSVVLWYVLRWISASPRARGGRVRDACGAAQQTIKTYTRTRTYICHLSPLALTCIDSAHSKIRILLLLLQRLKLSILAAAF